MTAGGRARVTMAAVVPAAAAAGLLLWCAAGPSSAQPPSLPESRFAGLEWTFVRIRYTAWTVPPGRAMSQEDEPWFIDAPAAEQTLSRRSKRTSRI